MCLGLPRTGTTSLLEAMAILGYGTIYNSREMLNMHQEAFCAAGIEAKYGCPNGGVGTRPFRLEQFESLWADYKAISGEATAVFAEELIAMYPGAKVILTVRDDEETWLRSLMNLVWHVRATPLAVALLYLSPWHRGMNMFADAFFRYLFFNDPLRHGVRVYREHNAMVKRLVEPGRLLVFDPKQGWGPLCEFLGKEVPVDPYPHLFKNPELRAAFRQDYMAAVKQLLFRGIVKGVVPIVVVAGLWLSRDRFKVQPNDWLAP